MVVSEQDLEQVQGVFPELYWNKNKTWIVGEFSFSAYFDGEKLRLNPRDKSHKYYFTGYYQIEIRLNNINQYGLPKVYEIGDKIERFARENNIEMMDLHINGDDSCCLGIFLPGEVLNMSFNSFVVEYVFSFFAWQAYRSTFMIKPPWGEYSHFGAGEREKILEVINKMSVTGRNEPCPCGSGRKYKKCCMDFHSKMISRKKDHNVKK